MTPTLILVVDSNTEARKTLCLFLKNDGYETAEANGGKAAIHQLSSIRPALIILDSDLSLIDGFKVCSKILKKFTQRNAPIIIAIPQGNAESVDQAFAVGAEEYVTKPIHQMALGRLIKKILERQAIDMALDGTKKALARNSVSELGRANDALNVSEEKFSALVECAPDTIMILDEGGQVLFINHTPPGLEDNLNGRRLLNFLPEQSKPKFNRFMNNIFSNSQKESFNIEGPSGTW